MGVLSNDMKEVASVAVAADGTASASVPGRGMLSFLVSAKGNGTVV